MAAAALALSSCSGFLDKFPETSLSPETFYTNEQECRLATNRFYDLVTAPDNTTNGALQDNDLQYHISLSGLQKGTRSAETASWSKDTWKYLRYINYYLAHSGNCTNEAVRTKSDAVACFFHAWF